MRTQKIVLLPFYTFPSASLMLPCINYLVITSKSYSTTHVQKRNNKTSLKPTTSYSYYPFLCSKISQKYHLKSLRAVLQFSIFMSPPAEVALLSLCDYVFHQHDIASSTHLLETLSPLGFCNSNTSLFSPIILASPKSKAS